MQVEDEQKIAQIPTKGGADNAQTSQLEDTIFKVSGQLSTISRMQKYFRTRENRNFSTVKSTEQRIFNFSLVEVLMMVGMAALQVLVVRFFFQGARKGEYLGCFVERFDADYIRLCVSYSLKINRLCDTTAIRYYETTGWLRTFFQQIPLRHGHVLRSLDKAKPAICDTT